MRQMRKYLFMLCTIAASISCERQELEDPYQYLAHIPININWEESLMDLDLVGNVSIYFYPDDGGAPIVKLSDNIYYNMVKLPMGRYSILIFNDLADNIKGIKIFDIDRYTTGNANIIKGDPTTPRYYELADNEVLATPHGRVASWHMDSFVVDEELIKYTRSYEFEKFIAQVKSRAGFSKATDNTVISMPAIAKDIDDEQTKSLEELTNVMMQPETTIVNVRVRIENLNNAMIIETILRGTANGAMLTTDESIVVANERPIYHQIVKNRTYDDPKNGIDGYIHYTHNTFGRVEDDEQYILIFKIILQTGAMSEYEIDVTDDFISANGRTVNIEIGDFDNPDKPLDPDKPVIPDDPDEKPKDPIVLPPFSSAGFNVGDWNNETVYL